jgi:hypothetical protein
MDRTRPSARAGGRAAAPAPPPAGPPRIGLRPGPWDPGPAAAPHARASRGPARPSASGLAAARGELSEADRGCTGAMEECTRRVGPFSTPKTEGAELSTRWVGESG